MKRRGFNPTNGLRKARPTGRAATADRDARRKGRPTENRERLERRYRQGQRPKLTPHYAKQMAIFLEVGIPAEGSLRRCAPKIVDDVVEAVLAEWLRDPLLRRAIAELHGGDWEQLTKERRVELAFDKAIAEMAHFVMTNDYVSVDGPDRAKYLQALEYIEKATHEGEGPGDAVAEFLKGLLADKARLVIPQETVVAVPPDPLLALTAGVVGTKES